MLRDLLWFVLGGWIGSVLTLVMVALLRKSREVPKPKADQAKQAGLERTSTGTDDA